MNHIVKKLIGNFDLNAGETLFGGRLLSWIDEEAGICVIDLVGHRRVVTKYISEINFVSSAKRGDLIEIGFFPTYFGKTSIALRCRVRNAVTGDSILTVERIVFVTLDEEGRPSAHGRTVEAAANLK